MNCIALDDEPLALELLGHFIGKTSLLHPLGLYLDYKEAISKISQGNVDLLFLDIQMNDISGLDFFKHLTFSPLVIFTTAFREYAANGFELDAIDYLVKPFDYERFEKSVLKAYEYWRYKNQRNSEPSYMFVKSEYKLVKVEFDNINYIEAYDDYLKIHLYSTKKCILTLTRMKTMEALLPADRFLRVHRSFIVPITAICSIRNKKLNIGDREIPIGVNYLEGLKRYILF